jgi:DNA-binding beta-propeller fold protein YncE
MTALYSGHGARRVRLGLQLGLAVVVGAMALCAPSAFAVSATDTYAPSAVFANDFSLGGPTRAAVEPGTGNLLVTDTDGSKVSVYARASGNGVPSLLTTFSAGTPQGIAIDQTTGAVYIGDSSANVIHKFVSNGQPTPTYTEDTATWTSPAQGAGAGELGDFAGPIAVDPTTHDVLVGDTTNRRVTRFDDGGAAVTNGSLDGSDTTDGQFTQILGLAVAASGTIYVDDAPIDPTYGAPSRLETFDSAGASTGPMLGLNQPIGVAINPTNGRVHVTDGATYNVNTRTLYVFDGGTTTPAASYDIDPALHGWNTGVAVDPANGKTYIVSMFSSRPPAAQVFVPTSNPGIVLDAPDNVDATSVDFSGIVTPGVDDANAHFEYSSDGGANWTSTTPDTAVSASSGGVPTADAPVTAHVTGLRPNTQYSLRLRASNANGGRTDSAVRTFSTAAVPPDVSDTIVTDRLATSATIHGKVTPFGQQTTYYVEYGTTTGYGNRAPAGAGDVAGAGYAARAVSEGLTGLSAGTVYHVRLVAKNASGTTTGPDMAFTTRAAAEARRVYEQVTPANKDGLVILPRAGYVPALSGDAITYQTNAMPDHDDVESTPKAGIVVGTRDTAGWAMHPTDVPQYPKPAPKPLFFSTLALSDDGSKAVVASNQALTPGAVDHGGNLFVRDVATGALQLVAGVPGGALYEHLTGFVSSEAFSGGSSDFSAILFSLPDVLTPDAPSGANSVYLWSHGQLSLASVLPDGSAALNAFGYGVSTDGKKLVFQSDEGVFVREGEHTTAASISHRAGGPSGAQPALIADVTRDARYVLFRVDAPVGLTDDAPDKAHDFYRYDTETQDLVYLFNSGLAQPINTLMSDDGSSVVFEDATSIGNVWRAGGVIPIAPHWGAGDMLKADVSPNGRYVVFNSWKVPSSYDNTNPTACQTADGNTPTEGHCVEVWVFDVVQNKLTCASCPADGSRSTGHAYPGTTVPSASHISAYVQHAVTDTGLAFFDTPTPLVDADANGAPDAYVFEDGQVQLLSSGAPGTIARFVGTAGGGRDAFIATNAQLVSQDRDSAFDLYDARVGGGIASQMTGDNSPAVCGGVECREPTAGPVASPTPPSQRVDGDGNLKAPPSKAKVSVVGLSFTQTAAHVRVKVSGRGLIKVSGASIKTASLTATKAGTYTVIAKWTSKTRFARRRGRKVKVALKASLTPPFGSVGSSKVSRTLGK